MAEEGDPCNPQIIKKEEQAMSTGMQAAYEAAFATYWQAAWAGFEAMIEKVKENPQLAKSTRRIEAKWVENNGIEVKIGDHALIVGGDDGLGPGSLSLVGLAGCSLGAFALAAASKGIPVDSVEVTVTADIDMRGQMDLEDGVPKGFTNICHEARIQSSASEKVIKKLKATAESWCPAYDTIVRPHEIEGKVLLNGKPVS